MTFAYIIIIQAPILVKSTVGVVLRTIALIKRRYCKLSPLFIAMMCSFRRLMCSNEIEENHGNTIMIMRYYAD